MLSYSEHPRLLPLSKDLVCSPRTPHLLRRMSLAFTVSNCEFGYNIATTKWSRTPIRKSFFTPQQSLTPSRGRQRSWPNSIVFAVAEPHTEKVDIEKIVNGVYEAFDEAKRAILGASDENTVEQLRVSYLGKKGKITSRMTLMGKIGKQDKPLLGKAISETKKQLEPLIEKRKEELLRERMERQMEEESIDVTMPGLPVIPEVGGLHPIWSTIDRAVDIFVSLGYELVDDPELNREIETDYYCFTALNCPENHPARAMQDTFYMKEDKSLLLRTHTSSVQIRYMEKNKPPLRIIAPGRVYRRDSLDATHSPVFHQVEILAIDKDMNLGKLRATVIHFLQQMFGDDVKTRFRGSYFPFTEPSMEVDVFFKGKWMEILGCGIVDVDVLKNVGIDPDEYVGFAAGFGVERLAMVMHGITDIRELYNSDMRFLEQLPKGPFG